MRILLSCKEFDHGIVKVTEEVSKSHDIVYWIGNKQHEQEVMNISSNIIFHDKKRALIGEPAETLVDVPFPPPDKELLEKLYKYESIIMTMMNRKFAALGVDERRHVYYHMVAYWNKILDMYRPDIIFFNVIPHAVFNYVIYALAKVRNIKMLMYVDTWAPDRMVPLYDYTKESYVLKAALDKTTKRKYTLKDLSKEMQAYYSEQTKAKDATPHYIKRQVRENTFLRRISAKAKGVSNSLRRKNFFSDVLNAVNRIVVNPKKTARKEYFSYQNNNPSLNVSFVYVPLHYQPERTTSPQGEEFSDQILLIETLAHSLPHGWKIYVKEHPMQWFLRGSNNLYRFRSVRYLGYYKRIASLANVELIPTTIESRKLMQKARATAIITGTAGFESILHRTPVFVFGYPWYRESDLVFRVSDTLSCKKAFNDIQNGFTITQENVLHFLKSVDDASIHAYIDEFGKKNSDLDPGENVRNVARIVKGDIDRRIHE